MKRFIRKGVLAMAILIQFCTVYTVKSQNSVTMFLIDQGWSGDTNFIELRASQFQDVSSMHFSIHEQNLKGSFFEIDQIQIPNFQAGSNYSFDGTKLNIQWNSPIIGYNLPDGQLLFRIKWVSSPAQKPCLEIFNNPTVVKINNSVFSNHPISGHSSCESLIAIPSFFSAYIDNNLNCSYENPELVYNYYTIIDSFKQNIHIYKNPQFLIYAKADFGRHHFKIIPEYPVWTSCNGDQIVDVDSTTKIISLVYGIQALISCPQLVAEIHAPVVRRCIDYKYYINFSNSGTKAEDSAKLQIKLDPFMILTGSSIPPSSIQYPFVEFNLGRLDIYQKGQMEITVNIDCNSTITGQTHCVTAQMLPHRDCIQSALWSGASIKLETSCNTGKVKFRIENAGKADMADPVKYWIVEDDIMPGLKKDVKLNKGQYLDLEYTTNGKSYRILTDQVDNHPGHSNPTVAFEGCGRDGGGDFSKGYLLMFPEDEEDPDIAIDCQASRASYDPNDKSAMPLGYGIDKLIEPGRSIEYKIRFQNIGNDTAFKVIVIDTLDQWLDPASIKVLGASHEFSFSLVDRILTFRFDPIYLPYRAIDDAASNGYIIYSIKPKIEAPLNSIITNTAEVYFDFNPAIITNTTLHKLATDFIIVAVSPTDPDNTNVNIYPNPGTDFLTIHSESMSMEKEVGIYDAFGQLIISQKLYGKKCKINLEKKLHSGVYIIRVKDLHNKIYSGKIIVEH